MGLSSESTGAAVLNSCGTMLLAQKSTADDKVIALAGNPNVGKSTVFNNLTGMNQHTGNWPGKTVANAQGNYQYKNTRFILVDLPGTYSLMANSEEEEIARNFICFGNPDAIVVVADATCLERNLNLVLQTMEISDHVILCVNLLDEAKKKKIKINLNLLSEELGIPVIGTSARSGKGLNQLMDAVWETSKQNFHSHPLRIVYDENIEEAVSSLEPVIQKSIGDKINSRWIALKLLENDTKLLDTLKNHLGCDIRNDHELCEKLSKTNEYLERQKISNDDFRDRIVSQIVKICETISKKTTTCEKAEYALRDRKIDKILTSKVTGIPIMILLLCGIFWLTLTGANYPSKIIANGLFWLEDWLSEFFISIGAPLWIKGILVDGCYRTLAWVVSVMLPPMMIFFPLFTLLEDLGYLPRVAFNMDNFFRKACAHGKQALTM